MSIPTIPRGDARPDLRPGAREGTGHKRIHGLPAGRDEHFVLMRPRQRLMLVGAIFFTFATLGPLFGLMRTGPTDPWWAVGLWMVFCGGISVGWALSFMWSLWLLPVVLAAQCVLPVLLGRLVGNPWRMGIDGLALGVSAIACLVVGYILSTMFINAEGRRRLALQAELDVAQRIHASLVPPIDARPAGLEVFGVSRASSEMGGDLLDLIEEGGRTGVYLADVSGHGVGAGVVMAMVKASIRMRLREEAQIDSLLNDLNTVVTGVTAPEMFVTFACLRFGPPTPVRLVEVGLAGHLPIFHWSAAERAVRDLPNERLPLGVMDEERYLSQRADARPGDLFALYTDGFTEAMDKQGRQFGIARLRDQIARLAERPLSEVHAGVLGAVSAHTNGAAPADDQTLVLVRVTA